MINVRKNHTVFGRGEMKLLYPQQPQGAGLCPRDGGGDRPLRRQPVALGTGRRDRPVSDYRGRVPVELTGRSPFPPVGELPYLLTLPAYGFYWFLLADEVDAPRWHQEITPLLPEFLTLTTRDGRVSTALAGREGRELERDTMPKFLPLQRWFASKDKRIRSVDIVELAELDGRHSLSVLEVKIDGETERYFMPLAAIWGEEHVSHGAPTLWATVAKLRRGPRVGAMIDGDRRRGHGAAPARGGCARDEVVDAAEGRIVFHGNDRLREIESAGEPRTAVGGAEQRVDRLWRQRHSQALPTPARGRAARCRGGALPDRRGRLRQYARLPRQSGASARGRIEPLRWARRSATSRTRATRGRISSTRSTAISRISSVAERRGSGRPHLRRPARRRRIAGSAHRRAAPGAATQTDDPAFAAEEITADDVAVWVAEVKAEIDANLAALDRSLSSLDEDARAMAQRVLDGRGVLTDRLDAVRTHDPFGPAHPHPRRLSPGPGPGGAERRDDHRLRGRAPPSVEERRAKSSAAARRRGNAALARLCRLVRAEQAHRDGRRLRGRDRARRTLAARRRCANSRTPTTQQWPTAPCIPTTRTSRGRFWISSWCRRPSMKSDTSSPAARTG